jgi:hypothetical protein
VSCVRVHAAVLVLYLVQWYDTALTERTVQYRSLVVWRDRETLEFGGFSIVVRETPVLGGFRFGRGIYCMHFSTFKDLAKGLLFFPLLILHAPLTLLYSTVQ